jgi:hypothetical protein
MVKANTRAPIGIGIFLACLLLAVFTVKKMEAGSSAPANGACQEAGLFPSAAWHCLHAGAGWTAER